MELGCHCICPPLWMPAFDDDSSRIISESAARKKFTLRFPRWATTLSASAKDLLYNLLDVDPKAAIQQNKRLTHVVEADVLCNNNFSDVCPFTRRTSPRTRAQRKYHRVRGQLSLMKWKKRSKRRKKGDNEE